MQYDNQVRAALDATRGSQSRDARPFPIDVSTTYTLSCLANGRHATGDPSVGCTGWIAPLVYAAHECRCVCHEIVPRAPFAQVLQLVRTRIGAAPRNASLLSRSLVAAGQGR